MNVRDHSARRRLAASNGVLRARDSPSGEDRRKRDRARQVRGAAAHLRDRERERRSVHEAPARHGEVDEVLRAVVVDADVVEDARGEVRREAVPGPLRREPEERADEQPPAHARRCDDRLPAALCLLLLQRERRLYLGTLEAHEFGVETALGMVFGENRVCLLPAALRDKPPARAREIPLA